MLLDDIKNLLKEVSAPGIVHIDPQRVKIHLVGLIELEERRMTHYKTGVIPNLIKDLNELIDTANDIIPATSHQEDQLFNLAQNISIVRNIVIKELM